MTPPTNASSATARLPGSDARDLTDGPLASFLHDVDVTRFDSRVGRPITLVLAAGVALVAAALGAGAAFAVGLAMAIGLSVVILRMERDRWHAQDVVRWYFADRADRWLRDTGGTGPRGDPAATEVWLGAHQPGTVPQVYRALAAFHTGDERVLSRELAALPDTSPEERAWKLWVTEGERWNATAVADTSELATVVAALPAGRDRAMFESWLAAVESSRRHAAGDPSWLAPLTSQRTPDRWTRLGRWTRFRIWLGRFGAVIAFAVSAFTISYLALAIAARDDVPRTEYQQTEIFLRGDVPPEDADASRRVAERLRSLERAIGEASRVAGPLDPDQVQAAQLDGLPTFIWTVGAIQFTVPRDAADRQVWEVEILLGGETSSSANAIVTFDGSTGPRYLYRIDPAVILALRTAVGITDGR